MLNGQTVKSIWASSVIQHDVTEEIVADFASKIESTATAPLLEEIERLKQRCAELENDAERLLSLLRRVRRFPENVIYKGSLLWGDILQELDSAKSGQEHSNG